MRAIVAIQGLVLAAVLAGVPACTGGDGEAPKAPGQGTMDANTWSGAGKTGSAEEPGQEPARKPAEKPAEKPPGKPVKSTGQPPAKPSPKPPAKVPATPPGKGDAKGKAKALIKEHLEKNGVHLDLERKVVWVPATFCITNAVLEYLAVAKTGKDHESLLLCQCRPSALNTAFIAMGLKPGHNYRFKEKVPPPPEEDVLSGKVKPYILVHPEGPGLYLTVEWKDDKGGVRRYRAEDLVWNMKTKKPVERRRWIYFGSRMAALNKGETPVFMADMECNLVSLCYLYPSNHLLTMRHPDGMNQSIWWPNTKLVPAKGTPARLYFSLEPLK